MCSDLCPYLATCAYILFVHWHLQYHTIVTTVSYHYDYAVDFGSHLQ